MPQSHTNLFYALIKNQSPPFYLDALEISRALSSGEVSYEIMTNLLRETNDAQFGIVSKLNQQNEWVRDATQAISLKDRIPHDHPALEANQALLRCLSRLKPIDYAIGNKKELDAHTMQSIRNNIKRRYADFAQNILLLAENNDITEEKKRKQTMELEQSFNTFLVECLHQANLTWGCETEAEAEKLLFHYRNLSSVLEPSRTLITLTYDKVARIFQRETQYPVTRKTALQKAEMARLKEVVVYPLKTEKNSHTSLPPAMQEANSIFADLIARDDRALPAQTRKTHLVGSKNAFVVKNELIPVQVLPEDTSSLHAQPENVLWLGRMGSPVFVGKGEKETARQTHTRENLEQMRITAQEKMGRKSLKLHLTTLNTVTPLENQATIVSHLYQATRENQTTEDDISYAPTNPDGTFRRLDVSRHLPQDRVGEISPLQKATRLASVSHIMLAARNQKDTFSLVNCASGQDRTGTAVEKTTQDWMKQRYQAFGKDTGNIDHMRAEGGNAAEITTHHVHGSPGMKIESKALQEA